MKAEEMLAAYLNDAGETLMHFNEKHDAKGRFAKKNGSSTGASKPARTTNMGIDVNDKVSREGFLSIYGMYSSKIPKSAYHHSYEGTGAKFVDNAQYQIVRNITRSLLSQSAKTGYGNNLLAGVSGYSDNGYTNKYKLINAVAKEVLTDYEENITDPDLLTYQMINGGRGTADDEKFKDMVWNTVTEELEKEMKRQGMANMPNEIAIANAHASRANGKTGARISLADRINAAYKKASDATKDKPSATVRTLKGKLSDLVNKVDSAAKSGKDKASSLVSKGKSFLDKAFVTTTSYHTQAEKMGDKAKKGLTTVTTAFHTQAEKLKKKKNGLTTTVYDTSSYKNR